MKTVTQVSKKTLQEGMVAKEKSKIRALSFEQVITEAANIIVDLGFHIVVEKRDPDSAEIHITNAGDSVRLGWTSVTRTHLGAYLVGGVYTGCFMANSDDKSISRILAKPFLELQERANQEKGVSK